MINSTTRIIQSSYYLDVAKTLFHDIKSKEAGAVFNVINISLKIQNCHIDKCYAPNAVAVYAQNCILGMSYCCFSELSVTYTGNNNEGVIIDVAYTPSNVKYCSVYKCAESKSLGADSTFWTRDGRYLFSYSNITSCNGISGSITFTKFEDVYGSMIMYCSTSHCTNKNLVENYVNVVSSNFIDCDVQYFGYTEINYTNCYFMGISSKINFGSVYCFDCIGEYPNKFVSGTSICLPLIRNNICYNPNVIECTFKQYISLNVCLIGMLFL